MLKSGINQKLFKNLSQVYKMPPQKFDSFLVLDFEATCEEGIRISKPEIIEFPVLKVNGSTFDITERFHIYVRPVLKPELTDFCTKLTGITQDIVDSSEVFPNVFGDFQAWLMEKVGPNERFLFVTCGDWDLKSMLPDQCKREDIVLPPYFKTWMNIKKAYSHQTGVFPKGMMQMLKELGIEHVGKHHSGIDDCSNIANILSALNNLGCVFRPTAGDKRYGPPPPPQLAMYAKAAGCSKSDSGNESRHFSTESKDKVSLYPSLSGYDSPTKEMHGSLYEPDDHSDGDRNVSGKYDETSFKAEKEYPSSQTSCSAKGVLPECPDFPTIILKLKEHLLSKNFKSREQEELQVVLASGKYLQLMEAEDRTVIETRLRYFYVSLVHGRRVAKKDSKSLSTSEVGIHLDPDLVGSRRRHRNKGSRKHKHEHSNDN